MSPETVEKVRSELVTFVAARVETPEVAEDIVQEVFARLVAVGEEEKIIDARAWLYRATRNAIVDHYRRSKSLTALPSDLLHEEPSDLPNEATRELALCLRPMMAGLSSDRSRAVQLVDLEGRTHREAAEIEGVSVPGMKSRVQRGRRELVVLLQQCCDVERDSTGAVFDYTPRASSHRNDIDRFSSDES